jgi:hypothetical protein
MTMARALVDDVIFRIMAWVDLSTLASMRRACRLFALIASHPTVWCARLEAMGVAHPVYDLHGAGLVRESDSPFVRHVIIERYAKAGTYLRGVTGSLHARPDNFGIEVDLKWDTTHHGTGEAVRRDNLKVGDHICARSRSGALDHAIVVSRVRQAVPGGDPAGLSSFTWDVTVLALRNSGPYEKPLGEWLDESTTAWILVSSPDLRRDRSAFEQRIATIRNRLLRDDHVDSGLSVLGGLSLAVFCTTGILERDDVLESFLPADPAAW